jgi:hypothetical protein
MTDKTEIKTQWKIWGIAFLIGTTVGMFAQQHIFIHSLQKDCEILGLFRIGDTPYHCKPSIK